MKKSKKRFNPPDLLKTVSRTIDEHQMFAPGDAVLAGVSGGSDSVLLLHILVEIAPEFSLHLGVAHLNHSLRGAESDRDEAFVARLVRKYSLPFFSDQKDVFAYRKKHGLSLEDAARQVRYAFFDDICRKHGFGKIALAHHMNDNAELILMHLLRGSGITGVSGIPPVREKKIVRPLINVPRSHIEDWLNRHNLPFVTDSSNTDLRHTRNRIRHDLIPRLESGYNPNIISTLHRFGTIMRDENQWMEDLADQAFNSCVIDCKSLSVALSKESFSTFSVPLQRRVLRKAIKHLKGNLLKITFSHIEQVLTVLKNQKTYKILDLPDRLRVASDPKALRITREAAPLRSVPKYEPPIAFSLEINGPGVWAIAEANMTLTLSEQIIDPPFHRDKEWGKAGQHIAFFDMESIGYPLLVRNPMPGDRFIPLGMQGVQKLSRYFANNKVQVEERIRCPVLLYKHHIIWVAGHRIGEMAKVTCRTRRILKAELMLA